MVALPAAASTGSLWSSTSNELIVESSASEKSVPIVLPRGNRNVESQNLVCNGMAHCFMRAN